MTEPQSLPEGYYQEYKIPKKGGKFRKITAPSADLLKYQRTKLPELEKHFYDQVKKTPIANTVHGFLKNRNCVTGAMQHIGYSTTVMMDISNFFDTVLLHMVPASLRDPSLFHQKGYAAQGFATSPMIANIAFIPAMQQIHQLLDDLYEDFAFTIYADDIQISFNDDEYDDINELIADISAIIEHQGFQVNRKKTRIKYAHHGWRRILGVNVGETEVRATRKTMRKMRAAKHQANGSSLGGLTTWSKCLPARNYKAWK